MLIPFVNFALTITIAISIKLPPINTLVAYKNVGFHWFTPVITDNFINDTGENLYKLSLKKLYIAKSPNIIIAANNTPT